MIKLDRKSLASTDTKRLKKHKKFQWFHGTSFCMLLENVFKMLYDNIYSILLKNYQKEIDVYCW